MEKNEETNSWFYSMTVTISETHRKKIIEIAEQRQIPLSRILGGFVDKFIEKPRAFNFDFEIPELPKDNLSFEKQADLIFNFMKKKEMDGIGLDNLILVRHDIGIPEKLVFLYGFKTLLNQNRLSVRIKPEGPKTPKNYRIYTPKGFRKEKKKLHYTETKAYISHLKQVEKYKKLAETHKENKNVENN